VRNRIWFGVAFMTLGMASVGWGASAPIAPPTPQQVRHGVWLIPGGILPNHQPDGNSVVFDAPAGLVVLDTGRHLWHREAILALAHRLKKPIVAVVNSHWHLDHVSGNPALRAEFPGLKVYASDAINTALTGFLPSSATEAENYVNDPQLPEELRADIREDMLTIRNGGALKPDVVITASGSMSPGGRIIQVNLARYAATSGDVWLYDRKTGVAALGDLVTLPAPFLDTACPDGWKAALAQITATRFAIAIPGHGPLFAPAQVALYRRAFESFIACADSARPDSECGAGWADDVKPLLAPDGSDAKRAAAMAAEYVQMLRTNGGRSKYCEAPRNA
jgi:glyoxylase-like metal-dependent hydrolase (beta-lactamase superfamily II)